MHDVIASLISQHRQSVRHNGLVGRSTTDCSRRRVCFNLSDAGAGYRLELRPAAGDRSPSRRRAVTSRGLAVCCLQCDVMGTLALIMTEKSSSSSSQAFQSSDVIDSSSHLPPARQTILPGHVSPILRAKDSRASGADVRGQMYGFVIQ